MKRALATGTAIALAAATVGCGTKNEAPHRDGFEQNVEHIVKDIAPRHPEGSRFKGVDPQRLKKAASVTFKVAGKEHGVSLYSEKDVSPDNNTLSLYSSVQKQLGEVAIKYDEAVSLPLHNSQTAKAEIKTTMRVMENDSAVVVLGPDELSTSLSRRYSDMPAAVTFRPAENSELNRTMSFIGPSGSTYYDTAAVATEACQAIIDVQASEPDTKMSAQEVWCNSLGSAYAMALMGTSYQQYARALDTAPIRRWAAGENSYLSYVVLPPDAYQQIKDGYSPTQLQGLRPTT